MPYFLRRIWDPASYQGGRIRRRYFEGWYFKQADAKKQQIIALIPGVSFPSDGTSSHAFVQVLSSSGRSHYFSYPLESFQFDPQRPFNIRIEDTVFSEEGMTLRLRDDHTEIRGDIRFGPWTPWPVSALSPGVMGWYRFVPRMETYHGVLSMDHEVSGTIVLDGEAVRLDGGRGYAEKDWGRSFPSSWVWAQSNHFDRQGTSVSISVAKIPWMTGSFIGSIAGLKLDKTLHRFATYTGARLVDIDTGVNEAHLILRDRRTELEVAIHGCTSLILKSPVLGAMEGRDAESLGGTIDVVMRELRGGRAEPLFHGTGALAGIEVMDERNELGSSDRGKERFVESHVRRR